MFGEFEHVNYSRGYRVYFNLTKHVYSVQGYVPGTGWRVVYQFEHAVADVTGTRVYQSGRQRVLRTGQKQVHAYVLISADNFRPVGCALDLSRQAEGRDLIRSRRLTYSPFKGDSFVLVDGAGRAVDAWDAFGLFSFSVEDNRPLIFELV